MHKHTDIRRNTNYKRTNGIIFSWSAPIYIIPTQWNYIHAMLFSMQLFSRHTEFCDKYCMHSGSGHSVTTSLPWAWSLINGTLLTTREREKESMRIASIVNESHEPRNIIFIYCLRYRCSFFGVQLSGIGFWLYHAAAYQCTMHVSFIEYQSRAQLWFLLIVCWYN